MINFSELKSRALKALSGNWGKAIGAVVIAMFIPVTLSLIIEYNPSPLFSLLAMIIEIPFSTGLTIYFLSIAKGKRPEFNKIFDGFKNLFSYIVLFLEQLVFVYLWSLLLIIPGIIKALSYSMSNYILIENPTMNPIDAITESRRLMDGHKAELFLLYLSFLGWAILAALTFGIGYLWLIPYIQTTMANFYLKIKEEKGTNIKTSTVHSDEPNEIKNDSISEEPEVENTIIIDKKQVPNQAKDITSEDNNNPIKSK